MKFADGIVAQPEVLDASRDRVLAGLGALPTPRPDDVLALIGVGASDFLARGAARAWRDAGLRAFALSAAEVSAAGIAAADVYVAISESGRSTETIEAVRLLGDRPTVAVVNAPAAPLAQACAAVLHQDSGDDSPVYTTGYTAALQAVGLLGEHWSGRSSDWTTLPSLAREVLDAAADPMVAWSEVVADARIVDVVAAGASVATAGEGALILRESARLHTAAHETRNYLHGPMEPLDPETACVIVGSGRELRLARDTAALGCPTLLLTCDEEIRSDGALTVLRLPRTGSALAGAVLEMLPLQLLALAVAGRRGLPVEGFRYAQDDTKDDDAG